jgi:hypothetical protein
VTIIDRAYVEILPDFRAFSAATRAGVTAGFRGAVPAARAGGEQLGTGAAAGAAASGRRGGEGFVSKFKTALIGKSLIPAAIFTGVGVEVVKLAGTFQTQMTRLVTAAGEQAGSLKMVSDGVLKLARDTGTSTTQLASGMYMIESAGFHGQKALDVMKAAAQGAKVDMADTGVVANALTTALVDLGSKAGPPATVMSQLVAAVGRGKMTMDDLASSLHSVLPNAAAIGISFAQTTAAIATMTAQGISAQQATQNLNHAILSLANPTAQETKAMAAFGLSSTDVAQHLGQRGLTGTLQMITKAITDHMGPAGLTITNAMNTSTIAAGKANEMFKNLPAPVQKLAKGLTDGTLSIHEYRKSIGSMTFEQANLARQWLVSYSRAHGFSDLLKSGSPSALTYVAALAKMTGGQTGLQVALHLTGENMKTFQSSVKAISSAQAEAGGNVKDWEIKQTTFNQKMSQLKQVVITAGIAVGTKLLPVLSDAADIILRDVIPALGTFGHAVGDAFAFVRKSLLTPGNLDAMKGVFDRLKANVVPAIQAIGDYLSTWWNKILIPIFHWLQTNWPTISKVFQVAAQIIGAALLITVNAIRIYADALTGIINFFDSHRTTFAIFAGVITAVLLPAIVSLGVTTAISLGESIALWVLYGTEAMVNAVRSSVAWLIAQGGAYRAAAASAIAFAVIIGGWISTGAAALVSAGRQVIGWFMLRAAAGDTVVSQAAAFAAMIAGWAASAARAVAGAAVIAAGWVTAAAGAIASVAVQVGAWIVLGTQSLIQAARIALAWVIAMGPVAWVIAGVIALVALIIWKWNTILAWTKKIFTAVWSFVKDHWRLIVAVIMGPIALLVLFIISHWNTIKNAIINASQAVLNFLSSMGGKIIGFFAAAASWLLNAGQRLIQGLWNGITAIWRGVGQWFGNLGRAIGSLITAGAVYLTNAGQRLLNALWNGITATWRGIGQWFGRLGRGIAGLIAGGMGFLEARGAAIMNHLWDGIKSVWNNIKNWFGSLPKKILGALGIKSPPSWAIDAGKHIMSGILKGIVNKAGGATAFLGRWAKQAGGALSIGGPDISSMLVKASGSLGQWVQAALQLTGTPGTWFAPLLRRISYESGGNPNAINLTDSNAAAGHPSQGLMQTIPSTFAAYHLPGTSLNINDPIANIAAGIRYIRSRYGSIFAIDPPVSGYKTGAWSIPKTEMAYVHKGEMIIPAGPAEQIRSTPRSAGSGSVITEESLVRSFSRSLAGMGIQIDTDGLARLVSAKQNVNAIKGPRR